MPGVMTSLVPLLYGFPVLEVYLPAVMSKVVAGNFGPRLKGISPHFGLAIRVNFKTIWRCEMNLPGFNAELSLGPTRDRFPGNDAFSRFPSEGGRVIPQFRFPATSDPDIGSYLRCRANGGNDLVCRFFGGLPPFTIGGLLF